MKTTNLHLLDIFCGQGGAAMGYSRAGFEVKGIDLSKPMLARYPFESHCMDWQEGLKRFADWADVIHLSPPCQHYSTATRNNDRDKHPDLIGPVREAAEAIGKPYIIENVGGAPLINPVELCGCMFGMVTTYKNVDLAIYRKRLFETSFYVGQPGHAAHNREPLDVFGHGSQGRFYKKFGFGIPASIIKETMGCEWTSAWAGVSEAIPPAFTQYVGSYVASYLGMRNAA